MPEVAENDSEEDEVMRNGTEEPTATQRKTQTTKAKRGDRDVSIESQADSPSRQLNGHFDANALPELPPGPEAQEMLDLVRVEAKKHGRVNQVSHLQALLGSFTGDFDSI